MKTEEVCEKINARLLEALEAGTPPWRKTWKGGLSALPMNATTNKHYHGVNVWTLLCGGYADPRWLTFKQARTLGGSVRKGEKGMPVIFWKPYTRAVDTDAQGETVTLTSVILKYYTVFNVSQCDGLDLPSLETDPQPFEPIEAAEATLEGFFGDLRGGSHFGGTRACYAPEADAIYLPQREAFDSPEAFYATAFHECAHATGHRTRLAREGLMNPVRFGDHTYSREELVAEFAASFVCGLVGIERQDQIENAAAYIAGWRKALKDDPRALVVAAGHAMHAAKWVTGEARPRASERSASVAA